ncbi:MAG: hypothetical protein Kow00124_21330 [Anaerolineae bacterium]
MIAVAGYTLTRRLSTLLLGFGLGVTLVVVVYLLTRREQEQVSAAPDEKAVATRPEHRIVLPPEPEPGTIMPAPERESRSADLPLSIQASPTPFKRGQVGSIIAETMPGASCTIEVLYSTRRPPSSLANVTLTAGPDGKCLWSWEVGTSGTFADVTVWALLEGYERAEDRQRIRIVD